MCWGNVGRHDAGSGNINSVGCSNLVTREPVCGCSYGYAPIVGVLVLLAAGAATGETIKAGIVGTGEFHPYGIVILFMSQVLLASLRWLLCLYPGRPCWSSTSAGFILDGC